jgi:hypothetical protein
MRPNLYDFLHKRFISTDWWVNYEEFRFLHNSPDYWDILEWIDENISNYVSIQFRIGELETIIRHLKEQI